MKHRLILVAMASALLAACHSKHEESAPLDNRTVLVYMAAENNLSSYLMSDVTEMMEGSLKLTDRDNLILFIDQPRKAPFFVRVEQGDTAHLEYMPREMKTSDPATLQMALSWAMEHYEAQSYGLVLWGHADGWIIKDDAAATRPRRSYGQDVQPTEQWMNIPDMAQAIETLPAADGAKPLKFIFADCCCFQSVESAYELRRCADYIIGSAAEIPGEGAPYETVVPALFSTADDFCRLAVDAYSAQESSGYKEPMAVVSTAEMDNLAEATRAVLAASIEPLPLGGYPDVDSLIYYYRHTLFDMNDFIMRHADSNNYAEWRRAFDRAVPYSTWQPVWMANHIYYQGAFGSSQFRDFVVTAERYGGVSMYVPQDASAVPASFRQDVSNQEATISRMQWYTAAGLDRLGW